VASELAPVVGERPQFLGHHLGNLECLHMGAAGFPPRGSDPKGLKAEATSTFMTSS